MSNLEIINTLDQLKEWQALADEANAMVENFKDIIKRHMDMQGVEELEAGPYIARFTSVKSSRFDVKSFKEKYGTATYASLCKQVTSRRFTISG